MKEILFHTRDRGRHKRGDPVAVQPAGMFIEAAEMRAWIRDSVEPAGLAALDSEVAEAWRKGTDECRTMGDPDDGLALTALLARYPRAPRREWLEMIAHVRARRSFYEANGFDTCWGEGDRQSYGIVQTDEDDVSKIMERDGQGRPKHVVNYRAALSQAERDEIERQDAPKRPLRGKVISKAALLVPRA